jgi:hypothetical protein
MIDFVDVVVGNSFAPEVVKRSLNPAGDDLRSGGVGCILKWFAFVGFRNLSRSGRDEEKEGQVVKEVAFQAMSLGGRR